MKRNEINGRSIRQQNNFPSKIIEAVAYKLFRMRRDKSVRRLIWTNHRERDGPEVRKSIQALQMKCVHGVLGRCQKILAPHCRNQKCMDIFSGIPFRIANAILEFRGATFPALGTICCSDRSYQHARDMKAWGPSLRALLQNGTVTWGKLDLLHMRGLIAENFLQNLKHCSKQSFFSNAVLRCTHKHNCDTNNGTPASMDEGWELPHQKDLKADPTLSKDQLLVFNLSLISKRDLVFSSVKWRKSYVFSATLVQMNGGKLLQGLVVWGIFALNVFPSFCFQYKLFLFLISTPTLNTNVGLPLLYQIYLQIQPPFELENIRGWVRIFFNHPPQTL